MSTRSVERMPALLSAIWSLWKFYPDLRLCQLLHSLVNRDPFYVEDDELLELVKRKYEEIREQRRLQSVADNS